jgi:hypothetical protein
MPSIKYNLSIFSFKKFKSILSIFLVLLNMFTLILIASFFFIVTLYTMLASLKLTA